MTTILESLAHQAGKRLKECGLKLVTAESCTGGGLGFWITCVPGSSDWYERGFITYSNQAKIDQLGVTAATLNNEGAVSEQAAREMAEGALKNSRADISIAITGIAGPADGTSQKPVGMVWIAWAGTHLATDTQMKIFSGDRHAIRMGAIQCALEIIEKLAATAS